VLIRILEQHFAARLRTMLCVRRPVCYGPDYVGLRWATLGYVEPLVEWCCR
jgi:hypothetical protein